MDDTPDDITCPDFELGLILFLFCQWSFFQLFFCDTGMSMPSFGCKKDAQDWRKLLEKYEKHKWNLQKSRWNLHHCVLVMQEIQTLQKAQRTQGIGYFDSLLTPLVQSRSFNKLWNLGQTSAWFRLAKRNPCISFYQSM